MPVDCKITCETSVRNQSLHLFSVWHCPNILSKYSCHSAHSYPPGLVCLWQVAWQDLVLWSSSSYLLQQNCRRPAQMQVIKSCFVWCAHLFSSISCVVEYCPVFFGFMVFECSCWVPCFLFSSIKMPWESALGSVNECIDLACIFIDFLGVQGTVVTKGTSSVWTQLPGGT